MRVQTATFAACALGLVAGVGAAVIIRPLDAPSLSSPALLFDAQSTQPLDAPSPSGSQTPSPLAPARRPCTRKPVWKCAPLDLDEFALDARRSNVLDGALVCAYPTRELDEKAGPYCSYDFTTGELVGEYNAYFCPETAVLVRKGC